MNFFGKKDESLNEERLKLTKIYLQQQKEENSELRRELARLQELVLRNRLLMDDLLNSVAANDKNIKGITEMNNSLEYSNKTNEENILKLEDEIKQLRGVKNTYIPTDFSLNSHGESLQGILDRVDATEDQLWFRDLNGDFWKIAKMDQGNQESDEEGTTNIDGFTIQVKLNE